MRREIIRLDSGWEPDTGACASPLISAETSEMGECGAIYDVPVGIRRI